MTAGSDWDRTAHSIGLRPPQMKATATPEFIGHCIERVGAHMDRAENSLDERVWKKHLEFASTYADILKALR